MREGETGEGNCEEEESLERDKTLSTKGVSQSLAPSLFYCVRRTLQKEPSPCFEASIACCCIAWSLSVSGGVFQFVSRSLALGVLSVSLLACRSCLSSPEAAAGAPQSPELLQRR